MRTTIRIFLSLTCATQKSGADSHTISMLIDTRIIPELNALNSTAGVGDVKRDTTRIVLEMLAMDDALEEVRWATSLITHWYRSFDEWHKSLEDALRHLVSTGEWPHILQIASSLLYTLSDDVRKPLMMLMVPLLNEVCVSCATTSFSHLRFWNSAWLMTRPHTLAFL